MHYHLYLFKIRRHEIHLSKNAGSVHLHGKSKDQSLGMWFEIIMMLFYYFYNYYSLVILAQQSS